MRTNCPNCGAVVDPAAKICAYCGTPYVWARQPLFVPAETDERPELAAATMHEILTPNEMRARLGLPPVKPGKVFFGPTPPEDTTGIWIETRD